MPILIFATRNAAIDVVGDHRPDIIKQLPSRVRVATSIAEQSSMIMIRHARRQVPVVRRAGK